jgi:hypothetical protein
MKKHFLALFLALVGLNVGAAIPVLTFTTTTNVFGLLGDSYFKDGDPTAPIVAPYTSAYFYEIWVSQTPSNYSLYENDSRAGENPDGFLTNHINLYTFAMQGYRSNAFDHFLFIKSTDNGGVINSNTYLVSWSNMCQAPRKMSDGSSLTLGTISGWASTASYNIYGLSDFPNFGGTGDPLLTTHGIQSAGATNATTLYGAGSFDILGGVYTSATNDYALYGGYHFWVTNGSKAGHPYRGGPLLAAIHLHQQMFDTNIASSVVSWTDGSVTSTNHCVITSSSKVGSVLTFTRKDNRTTWAWDAPNIALNITNDVTDAFLMEPAAANYIFYGLKVSGLTSGHIYQLVIGGLTIGTFTSTELATGPNGNGLNLFTNQSTPQWLQAVETLGRIREYEGCNRTNLVIRPAGDGVGLVWWQSSVSGAIATARGDTLLANTAAFTDRLQTNMVSVHTQVQPTNLVWQLTDVGSTPYNPMPFRR